MRISDWSSDVCSSDLPAQGFDLLFSRFGVMFFDDPAAAFAHLREALKAGGRLAFVCWRAAAENDWVWRPMGAIRDLVPQPPPPDPEAPGIGIAPCRERVCSQGRSRGWPYHEKK